MTDNSRIKLRHQREDQTMERAGLNACLRTPEGRAFIRKLLALGGFSQDMFEPNALVMAHNSGRQSFANQIFDMIMSLDPHSYGRLIEERMQIEAARQKEMNPNEK